MRHLSLFLIAVALALPAGVSAATYKDDVSPIFKAKCVKCHGGLIPMGGLKMNSLKNILKGGNSGKVVVPGNAAASIMYQQFSLPLSNPKHMPPAAEPQLTSGEIATIKAWIDGGAN